jgi:hypothetical protein
MTAKKKRSTQASPDPAKKAPSARQVRATPPVSAKRSRAARSNSTPEAAAEPTPASAPPHKKLSALDAAAQVLRESGQPMTCPELIAQMAAQAYWSSPTGKTPASTLYAALTREIHVKGEASRFVKTGPGKFAYRTAGRS